MTPERKRLVFRYGVAIDLVVIATGLALLGPSPAALLGIFFVTIAIVAWVVGWEAGLASTALSAIALMTSVEPGALRLDHVMIFAAAGVLVSAASSLIRPRIAALAEPPAAELPTPALVPAPVSARDIRIQNLAQYVGLPLLVIFVYANLSDILIRNFSIPSLLQPLIAALAIPIAMRRDYFKPARTTFRLLTFFLAGYLVVLFTSSTWARDPTLSDQRLTEFIKAFLIYFLVSTLAASWKSLRRALAAVVITAAVLASLTVVQFVTHDAIGEVGGLARIDRGNIYEEVSESRYAGPLGDPNFYAQILLPMVPIGLSLGLTERRRRVLRLAYFGLTALILCGLLLSYSRGGILALGVVVILIFFAVRIPRAYALSAAAAAFAVLLILLPTNVGRRLLTVKELLPGSAPQPTLENAVEKRKLVMRSALAMFNDHPIRGVGAANFSPYYNTYSNLVGTTVEEYDREFTPQFPHSLYVETAAETGVIGLTVLLAAIGSALAMLLRARRRLLVDMDSDHAALVQAIAIGITGYLITSVFLHSAFARYLWLLLGFAGAVGKLAKQQTGQLAEVNR